MDAEEARVYFSKIKYSELPIESLVRILAHGRIALAFSDWIGEASGEDNGPEEEVLYDTIQTAVKKSYEELKNRRRDIYSAGI